MLVSKAMIDAAKAAEFQYFKQSGLFNERCFAGTSDALIRLMIEAALLLDTLPVEAEQKKPYQRRPCRI